MRIFIAINFSAEEKQQILKLQTQLRSQAVRGSYPKPENLHLTLAFLGETPEEKINCLKEIIDGLKILPFEITFDHTGCFKRGRSGLWYLGIKPKPVDVGLTFLLNINSQLTNQIKKEKLYFDKKPFRAHVTLGKYIKSPKPIVLTFDPIRISVNSISLMKSERLDGVLTYTELHKYLQEK